ncbi:hypothetical protein GE061_005943 [Apolygus lucorum]|uniref:Uncharacterized protein n=1 Tax=Apolygus lucorum TaxID=248454 RepID=A0A6A4JC64_APOLU|nr:hypothetical protein GE061_005943 [Apolygus lucorum]
MKVLILLSLLCLGYVSGEDQPSLQEESIAPYICNAEEVLANSTELGKITLDLIKGTFSVVYDSMYPENHRGCPFGSLRCILWNLNEVVSVMRDVKDKISFFKDNVSDISNGINFYFTNCFTK